MIYCLTDQNRVSEGVNFPSIAKPHSIIDVIALEVGKGLDEGCIFHLNRMMCLCLKTYGIEHIMT